MIIRINKFLSSTGLRSRRKVEELLKNGEIKVNNNLALPGQLIDTEKDEVFYKDRRIVLKTNKIYLAFNKPYNVLSTTYDSRGRKTIMDFIKIKERIYPIGRLDYRSTGLILLTNDGDLTLKLTHPRYHLPKKYLVQTKEVITSDFIKSMTEAKMRIDDKKLIPTQVELIDEHNFEITLFQGMKRQIREMCRSLGYSINSLRRIQIGDIRLGDLKEGEFRNLSENEINNLKK